MEKPFEYYAFISYKREDEKWAKWLQKKLESYKLPSIIRKGKPELPKHIKPVFRDKTDLGAGILTDSLCKELEMSKYLIVICSPCAARSEWVGKEISSFIDMGRASFIIPFIIGGEPDSSDPEKECFHPVIKEKVPELLGINIGEIGKEQAFIKVVAKLLDLRFDVLWQRERRRRVRRRIGYAAFSVALVSVIVLVWNINQPFDMVVKPAYGYHGGLPFPGTGVYVSVSLDNQILTDTLYSPEDEALFVNIPAGYRNSEVGFRVSGAGFKDADTVLFASGSVVLPMARDEGYYGMVRGVVRNESNDVTVTGAMVSVGDISAVSGGNGEFELSIPLDRQQAEYEVVTEWQGKQSRHTAIYPMQNNPQIINAIYIP